MFLCHRCHWVLHCALVRDGEDAHHLVAVAHNALEHLSRELGLAQDGHLELVPWHRGAERSVEGVEVEEALVVADEGGGAAGKELKCIFAFSHSVLVSEKLILTFVFCLIMKLTVLQLHSTYSDAVIHNGSIICHS